MAVVTFRISEPLLREVLLRLSVDAEIVGAEVEAAPGGAVVLTLDAPGVPEDVVEIEPQYSRSPGPDPVHLTAITYLHADGSREHKPIGTPA